MKNEAEFCTVIKNSMVKGYKIPDESGFQYGAHTSIRCFDGIGMLDSKYFGENNNQLKFICWEAKYLKKPGAFAFSKIRPWQNEYLCAYEKADKVKSLVIVGIDYGRADKRAFVFEWNDNFSDLYNIGFSIHLKELEKLPYNKLSKGIFTFDNIITYDMVKNLYPDFNKTCEDFKKKMENNNGGSDL